MAAFTETHLIVLINCVFFVSKKSCRLLSVSKSYFELKTRKFKIEDIESFLFDQTVIDSTNMDIGSISDF